MVVEHKLFVCDCNSPDHQLIVTKITYTDIGDLEGTYIKTNEIYFTVGLTEDLPFFRRLRYVFGRNQPQVEIILSPDKVQELVKCLQDS